MNLLCILYVYIRVLSCCQAQAFSTLQPSRAGHVVLQRWFAPPWLLVTNFAGPPHLLAHTKKVRKTTLENEETGKIQSVFTGFPPVTASEKMTRALPEYHNPSFVTVRWWIFGLVFGYKINSPKCFEKDNLGFQRGPTKKHTHKTKKKKTLHLLFVVYPLLKFPSLHSSLCWKSSLRTKTSSK